MFASSHLETIHECELEPTTTKETTAATAAATTTTTTKSSTTTANVTIDVKPQAASVIESTSASTVDPPTPIASIKEVESFPSLPSLLEAPPTSTVDTTTPIASLKETDPIQTEGELNSQVASHGCSHACASYVIGVYSVRSGGQEAEAQDGGAIFTPIFF